MCEGNPSGQYQAVSSPEMMALRHKLFPYLISGLKRGATRNPNPIVAKTPEMGIQAMNLMQQMYAGDAFKSPGGTGTGYVGGLDRTSQGSGEAIGNSSDPRRYINKSPGSFAPIDRPRSGPGAMPDQMDPSIIMKLLATVGGQGNRFEPTG